MSIDGGAPTMVQSMTDTDTADAQATVRQLAGGRRRSVEVRVARTCRRTDGHDT